MSTSEDPSEPFGNDTYLRLLMENVADYAIFILDTHGRIANWNVGAERILGFSAEEIIGQLADVVFTPEDRRQRVPQLEMTQAERTGRADDERWHIRKDGSRFWASGILTALRDETGTLRGYVKILRDLTARKRAEEALAANQERYLDQERQAAVLQERNRMARELHDTLAQGFFSIALQLDAASESFEEAPGESQVHMTRAREIARESMLETRRMVRGLRPHELQRHTLTQAFADMIEQSRADTETAIAFRMEGEPGTLPPHVEDDLLRIGQEAFANALKHAHASQITVTLTFEAGQVRLEIEDNGRGFDPQANIGGGGFGQTSMRERAERIGGQLEIVSQPGAGTRVSLVVKSTLSHSKAWLLAALASMNDAVIAADTEGRVTYLNPAAEILTGWTQAQAVGQDVAVVYNVVDEATGEAIQRLLTDIAKESEASKVQEDILLIARSGKRTPVQDSAAAIHDVGGHTLGVIVTVHDDTGPRSIRQRAQAAIARLRENLEETHLRVKDHFQIAASLVEIRAEDDEGTVPAEDLRSLKLHIQALAHIHDLLTHKAEEAGEASFTSGKETLERLVPFLRAALTDRVIRFTAEHVRLSVKQSTALALIVNELTLNAIKYGKEDVEIGFQAADHTAILEVCDDGPGFPAGFDALVHSHTGLKLVQALVSHDLKGSVRYETRPEGGARVRVEFPASG